MGRAMHEDPQVPNYAGGPNRRYRLRPGVVLAGWTDDESDWRHEILAENLDTLRSATDAKGRKFEVHTLPMPEPISTCPIGLRHARARSCWRPIFIT